MVDFAPFAARVLRRLRPSPAMEAYGSYDSALAASATYEDPGIVEVVSTKTEAFRRALHASSIKSVSSPQTIQNMFVLSYVSNSRPVDVLEIGGACGASFLELDRLLPGRIRRWHVQETPAMAAAGRRLSRDARLGFHDDLEAAVSQLESLDLVITQGSLQYLRDPLQALEDLLKLGFAYFYITRTDVGDGIDGPVITRQTSNLSAHGPGTIAVDFADRKTSVPLTLVPLQAMTARIGPSSYNILYSFTESGDMSVLIGQRTITTRTVGFLLQRMG